LIASPFSAFKTTSVAAMNIVKSGEVIVNFFEKKNKLLGKFLNIPLLAVFLRVLLIQGYFETVHMIKTHVNA